MFHDFTQDLPASLSVVRTKRRSGTIWYAGAMLFIALMATSSAESAPDTALIMRQHPGTSFQTDRNTPFHSDAKASHTVPASTKRTEHLSDPNQLESLFNTESLSALLNRRDDALRERDLSAGYFVPAQAFGNLVPQVAPARTWLAKRGYTFQFAYKGEAWLM